MIAPILTKFWHDDTETRKRLELDDQRTEPQDVQLSGEKKKLLNLKSTESQKEAPELDTCPSRSWLSQSDELHQVGSRVACLDTVMSQSYQRCFSCTTVHHTRGSERSRIDSHIYHISLLPFISLSSRFIPLSNPSILLGLLAPLHPCVSIQYL